MVVEAGNQYGETLVADLCVRGVRLPQVEMLFDIHVVDTDTYSHICTKHPAECCLMLKLRKE